MSEKPTAPHIPIYLSMDDPEPLYAQIETQLRDFILSVVLASHPDAVSTSLDRTEHSVFGFGGKDVQPESLGDLPAHPDAPDAVAVSI